MKKELEIYIHIPFCVRKCAYCDFLSGPADAGTQEKYVDMLIREIYESSGLAEEYEVTTVFFGGGTPSILPGEWIAQIMTELKNVFSFREDVEVTIEVNPGTVTEEKLKIYFAAGINRLSIGLQSANDEELRCCLQVFGGQWLCNMVFR